jgi:gas vesicle protein
MNDRIYYSHEAEMQERRTRTLLAAIVLLVGASVGTLVAMIFAPQTGKDTRQMLANGAEGVYENGRETTSKMVQGLRKEFDKLRKDVEDHLQKA